MAVTSTSVSNPLVHNITIDTDCGNTVIADIGSGAVTVYSIHLNNAANGAKSYIKAFDSLSPTLGTDHPELIIKAYDNQVLDVVFPSGLFFATGFSFACVASAGTAGTTSPTSDVIIRIVTN